MCARGPNAAKKMKPAIRAFIDSQDVVDVSTLLCNEAFFLCSFTYVRNYATSVMVLIIPPGLDLFELLWFVIKAWTKYSDVKVLGIIAKRLASLHPFCGDAILEVDEAVACIDRHDQEKIKQAAKDHAQQNGSANSFKAAFRTKAQAVKVASGAAAIPAERKLPAHITQEGAANAKRRSTLW